MQTTKTSLVTALLALGVCVSAASGGAPMGPPFAFLEEGQWSIGGEFAHEQLDMEAFGTAVETFADEFTFFYAQPFTLEDFETNMFFGTLGYGICDNWNIFVRVGAADAQDDVILHPATSDFAEDRVGFDGDLGLAWGAGTRATFCRWGPWSFGGLFQVTWFDPGDSSFTLGDPASPDGAVVGDIGIDYWQTQVALSAVYQVDTWSLWAGPFLQFIEGDLNLDGQLVLDDIFDGSINVTADMEESSQIGGHVGANWELAEQWNLWVEGQITSDSWLVGVGAVFTPESFGL